ncbi:MAG: aminotransferase class IV [Myxococcota bacterium]
MDGWAIVDGTGTPLAEARIPITDVGFTHGYSVFETLMLGPGRDLADNLTRLSKSAAAAMISYPGDDLLRAEVARVAEQVGADAVVRITLTGDGRRIVWATPLETGRRGRPVRCATQPWLPQGSAIDGSVKHRSRMDWMVALRRHGADEILLVDAAGRFTEGTSSAVLASIDGRLMTAPWDGRILRSTTLARLLRLANDLGIDVVRQGALAKGPFDGLYLASTTRWLAPVIELDGRPLPGWDPIGKRLFDATEA